MIGTIIPKYSSNMFHFIPFFIGLIWDNKRYYLIATLFFMLQPATIFIIDPSNFIKDVRLLNKRCTTFIKELYAFRFICQDKTFFSSKQTNLFAWWIQNVSKTKQTGPTLEVKFYACFVIFYNVVAKGMEIKTLRVIKK